MYKKVTDDLVREKVTEISKEHHHWQRVCLLVLLRLPIGKLASRYFIYDKIQEWDCLNLSCRQGVGDMVKNRVVALLTISKVLRNLFLDGYLRKEDLDRRSLSQKEFEKICEKRVLGRPEQQELKPNHKWLQSAYYLSPEGRKLAREILFPPRKKRVARNTYERKRGGDQNCTRA